MEVSEWNLNINTQNFCLISITVLVKKKVAKHFAKTHKERALAKHLCYSRTNVREVHEMRTTMVAVRMRIGIYTVRELRNNTVAMGL